MAKSKESELWQMLNEALDKWAAEYTATLRAELEHYKEQNRVDRKSLDKLILELEESQKKVRELEAMLNAANKQAF